MLTARTAKLLALLVVVLVMGSHATPVQAQIGFQAELYDPPPVVSKYTETPNRFSAAMVPKSYAVLSPRLDYTPKVTGSSFDDHSLTFNTTFERSQTLVPVSVDADRFLNYRTQLSQQNRFEDLVSNSIYEAQRTNRRQGLSIGVALPKRFDKIFGEGGGNLRVSGYRRITFSGRSQWTDGKTELYNPSKFPSLNMEQVYRFDIAGTIGSKISVKVSEDSQTDIPLANRLQIRYKGDDDDIIKSIEAGNTNLQLPNTRFVGYSSRIQGLFGVKTEAQLGNLRVTGIASQEKGSSERASVTASGEENAEYIRDYQYVENRIFDLGYPGEFGPGDSVINALFYEFEPDERNREALDAKMVIYPDSIDYGTTPPSDPYDLQSDSMLVVQIAEDLYQFYNEEGEAPYVVFNSSRPSNKALGVWMVVARNDDAGDRIRVDTIGDISSQILVLKYIRPTPTNYSPAHKTWDLMWRNAYRIPKGVGVEDIDLKIFKGLDGTQGNTNNLDYQSVSGRNQGYYISILGLDQYNRQGQNRPDNVLDDRIEVFRPDWGLVIFPSRTPFNSDTTFQNADNTTVPLAEKVPNIYSYVSDVQRNENSKYYLQIASKTRSSIIRLNRTNIIEGSEQVRLNGQLLQRDVDYQVDYNLGQVTLLSSAATDPNADIDVDFEYAPFLALQKKTLLGMRAEYEWSRDLRFGSTILYKSDKAQDRKPRVGQETAKMTVLDFDAAFNLHPNFLTKMVDALPLIRTQTPSNISVSGEVAQSRPNPNVEDVAYIDDFESSSDELTLGMARANWTLASMPAQIDPFHYQRGKILWHNPLGGVATTEVYDKDYAQGEGTITTFRMIYQPLSHRIDTTFIDSTQTVIDTTDVKSWAGIMRYYGARVDAKRAQLFECRVAGKRGRLHFDFGLINEDVNGDGIPNTEDKDRNGAVDEFEDVGLDGVPDSLEEGYDPVTNPDPHGDNYYFLGDGKCPVPNDECADVQSRQEARDGAFYYRWLNGTEGNRNDLSALARPDRENLSSSGFEQKDAYFSYVVDLSDSLNNPFFVPGSERGPDEDPTKWRTFRIPIRDSLALDTIVTSSPDLTALWDKITHVRVWFESDDTISTADTVEVADWYFVQSNWQDTVVVDPTGQSNTNFVVATVSEDDGSFQAPPGVEPYQDTRNNVTESQSGLMLKYSNLRSRDTCLATKDLITVERYSGYRTLEMYVHGGDNIDQDSVQMFFRLGENDSVFYEYHSVVPVRSGWDPGNYVKIDFNDITALKDSAQRNLSEGKTYNDVDVSSGNYRVRGDPNINEILYFAVGVVNPNPEKEVSGDIWLDELRVTNVRKDVGTAGRISIAGNMADLLSYGFSYEYRDPYFRGISAATRGGSDNNLGSGQTQQGMSYNATLQLQQFLPRSVGARLPVSYSYSKSTQIPLLRTRSDIVLPENVRQEEKSVSETRSFRVSENFSHRGKNLLYDIFLNRQDVSFSYSRTNQTSVNRPYSLGENYNVDAGFDMGVSNPPKLPIFFWLKPIPILKKAAKSELGLFPNQWSWDGRFNRSLTLSDDIDGKRVSSLRREFSGSMNMSYRVFENLTASYNFTTKRDLSDPDRVNMSWNPSKIRLGLETNYNQSFNANYDPKLFNFIDSRFNYSARYSELYERSTDTRKSDVARSWGVTGTFKHLALLGGSGSRSSARSSTVRRVRRGTDEVDRSKEKPFYDPPLAVLRFLTGWIEPIGYKYTTGYNNSVPGMLDRPAWQYRFGIYDQTDVELGTDRRPPFASESEAYEFSSGFTFLGGIATDVRYKRGVTRDLVKQGDRKERRSVGWPDLSIRIQRFTTLPLIKGPINKFIDVFAPKTSYSRSISEDVSIDGGFVISHSENQDFSPLLSINFNLFRTLSFSGSYSVSKSRSLTYNPTDGALRNETLAERKSFQFSSKYSFTAPGGIAIPLFGKVKFKSEVSISVNVRQASNTSETSSTGGPFVLSVDKSDFSVSPVISYTFSRQVKGGLTARWQDTNDNIQNRKSHVRELQIWAEIRF